MRFGRTLGCTALLLAAAGLALASCSDLGYYRQAVSGQVDLLSRRHAITDLLNDPSTPAPLKARLGTALAARDFASSVLHLPDNGSYRCYADLGRSCVVWNVVAAPEFSLTPVRWCFPIAGCVPYRGYYDEAQARQFAEGLRAAGDDVYVYGVSAYSTLGWFDDPILNTFVNGPDYATAGLIFHELAHQQVYIKGDADFNEAFAMTVETQGVRLWLETHGDARQRQAYRLGQKRHDDFLALVAATRERLHELYQQALAPAEKRRAKEAILAGMRRDYAALKERWGGYGGYDRWFSGELNNARFVSVQTYRRLLPAFTRLFQEQGGDWPAFYRAVAGLAELPAQARRQRLETLLAKAPVAPGG